MVTDDTYVLDVDVKLYRSSTLGDQPVFNVIYLYLQVIYLRVLHTVVSCENNVIQKKKRVYLTLNTFENIKKTQREKRCAGRCYAVLYGILGSFFLSS